MSAVEHRNQDASCYIGNLDEKVTEELLWELMLQAGPVLSVNMPKEKITGKHMGYGFAQYRSEDDAEYAIKVLNMIKVYNKPIKVNKCSVSQTNNIVQENDIGANLFINNLDPMVDEKLLYDTFSSFGGIVNPPKIAVDEEGKSKGYGFISFDSFSASDLAIECMNGQYLSNRIISVQYAYKKDSPGIRHGTAAERMLAAAQPTKFQPHTNFSAGLGDLTTIQTSLTAPTSSAPAIPPAIPSPYLPPSMMIPPHLPPSPYIQPPSLPLNYSIPPPPPTAYSIPPPPPAAYNIPPPPPSYSIPPPPPSNYR